jgi:MFS transporter, PPP family, 3-phenylpropionic acid transporter
MVVVREQIVTKAASCRCAPSLIVPISAPFAYILLYVSMYAAYGVSSPFWPAFFETHGLTSQQIGFILSAGMLVRLAAGPLVGRLADVSGSLRAILATCAACAATVAAAFWLSNSFSSLLTVALLQAAALAPMTSLADALAVNVARPQLAGKPFEYGWLRGSASAAFVAGTLLAGQLVTRTNFTPIIWMNAALLAATAGATSLLPAAQRTMPCASRSKFFAGVSALFAVSRFRIIILVSALVFGSHALHDAFAVIRWSDAGIRTAVTSLLWSEAVAAEVLVFLFIGPALVRKLGVRSAAALAASAGVLRWSIEGATTSVLLLLVSQPLHGLTFALLHLACMREMAALVPSHQSATAQSLYAFAAGSVSAALTLLSGNLYAWYGGASFFAMSILCAVALPFAWFGLSDRQRQLT